MCVCQFKCIQLASECEHWYCYLYYCYICYCHAEVVWNFYSAPHTRTYAQLLSIAGGDACWRCMPLVLNQQNHCFFLHHLVACSCETAALSALSVCVSVMRNAYILHGRVCVCIGVGVHLLSLEWHKNLLLCHHIGFALVTPKCTLTVKRQCVCVCIFTSAKDCMQLSSKLSCTQNGCDNFKPAVNSIRYSGYYYHFSHTLTSTLVHNFYAFRLCVC